jgi:hypothetical protein
MYLFNSTGESITGDIMYLFNSTGESITGDIDPTSPISPLFSD